MEGFENPSSGGVISAMLAENLGPRAVSLQTGQRCVSARDTGVKEAFPGSYDRVSLLP